MASPEVGRVALMSIHPQYAAAIMAGTKKVEFRKRPIATDVTHVIVYATAPVSAIVGAFTVVDQAAAPPARLWRRFSRVGGITRRRFFSYYANHAQGVGIEVGKVLVPSEPMSLQHDFGVARPPQSFQYLPADTAEPALAGMIPIGTVSR